MIGGIKRGHISTYILSACHSYMIYVKSVYLILCPTWYYLCNIKNLKNTYGGVLRLEPNRPKRLI